MAANNSIRYSDLVSQPGPPGPAGQDGATGATGAKGAKGDTGNTGPAGTISAAADGSVGTPVFRFSSDPDTGIYRAGTNAIGFSTGGANRVTINSSGLTSVSNVTAYSDRRLKENIELIEYALDKVKQINGYTFNRKDMDNKRYSGVIADEVEQVLPEVIKTDANGYQTVDYSGIIGLLIEAIKELADGQNSR